MTTRAISNLPPHVETFIRNSETSTACLISIENMLRAQQRPRLGFFGWVGVMFIVLFVGASCAHAQTTQTTIRDASGRTIGTAATDSQGSTTFRDASGRTTGTASRDPQGNTTFRDASGRTTGTASHPNLPRR
jgi:hypothetical protein